MKEEIRAMLDDPAYHSNVEVESAEVYMQKHLKYVSRFQYIDLHQYVNNLKMKLRR